MKTTGAKILLNCLLEQGVDTIFGYPGGTILNVYDELYDYNDKITHVLTCHEQGAAHAADGYARATGKVGVCFATSGPGCTNLTTGIATAFFDSSPVVFITCNVMRSLVGRDSFQEVDIVGITKPITKANYMVNDVERLATVMREAFAIARSGRPGPVLIDIIKDVTSEACEFESIPLEQHTTKVAYASHLKRGTKDLNVPKPTQKDISVLIDMVSQAKKPMIICGGGVVLSRAQNEFLEFAEKMDSPVAITTRGAGAFRSTHPLSTGMIGMHGSRASNIAIDTCDLLIAIGSRFSDRVGLKFDSFAQHARVIHIDIDPKEINKNIKSHHHIIGDVKHVLSMVNEKLEQQDKKVWKEEIFSIETEIEYEKRPDTVTPKEALRTLADMLPDETIVTTDVGQHQMWAIQHFRFSYPGQLITSLGYGTMGFGLGAAIGAKTAFPKQTVLHITGDGSFLMNCNEMATEYKYKLPVITVVFNNNTLGMVRQWQGVFYKQRFSETDMNALPPFNKLAEAYGLRGRRVTSVDELKIAIEEAKASIAEGIGYVIDLAIWVDEVVKPMVRSGAHITDFTM